MSEARRGAWQGLGAYTAWGLLPLYWKALSQVPSLQLIAHRVVWSWLLLTGFLAASGQLASLRRAVADPEVRRTYLAASLLIGMNWFGFVWAVNSGLVVEASLGYFINPLLSVLLGVRVFGEELRTGQWLAVLLAAAGVAWLAVMHGGVPWISLFLATSFALYAMVKKRAPLPSVHGLALETGVLVVPAAAFLAWSEHAGTGAFGHQGAAGTVLLLASGGVTMLPLLLFASAARRIPMLWLGVLQYVSPCLQLAIGVLLFAEPFPRERLVGFSLVWAALAVFAVEGLLAHRAAAVEPLPE